MRKESPKKDARRFDALIQAAEEEPGTWFAEDYTAGVVGAAVSVYTHFGRKLVEVRTGGNTVHVRVKYAP